MEWKIRRQDTNKLVRDYLLHDRAFSNRLLKQIKRDGDLLIDGHSVNVRHQLSEGETLKVIFPEQSTNSHIKPIEMMLNIIFEDEFLIVLNKPRGLAVSPNMNDEITLANGLIHYYQSKGLNLSPHIVTRLDKYTSGVVIIAKHGYIHHLLSKQPIEREYRVMIDGQINLKHSTIDLPIARNMPSIIERKVDGKGKRAITHYEVIKEWRNCSLLKVKLETGRTHQIRVHFSHLGHPLVGDDLYGGSDYALKGQALHCRHVQFKHPVSERLIQCVASYPVELTNIINHCPLIQT